MKPKNRNKCELEKTGVCDKSRCVMCDKGYIPYREYREKVKKVRHRLFYAPDSNLPNQ